MNSVYADLKYSEFKEAIAMQPWWISGAICASIVLAMYLYYLYRTRKA